MPKYEVNITRTITERFIVTANDEDEAQEIAMFRQCEPEYTKDGDEDVWLREIHESP